MGRIANRAYRKWWRVPPAAVDALPYGDIVRADAIDLLLSLREACADIVFLDPPFNLGKEYGTDGPQDDHKADADYLAYIASIIHRSAAVLRPGGSLYLYHIPRWAIPLANLLQQHLTFCHWIAISMKNGFVRGRRLYPAHYALLHYTKGTPVQLNRPKIPAPRCRHCDGYIRDYGGYEHYIRRGINLSDVWDDISPVRHQKHKHRSCNELPSEIARRVLEISGKRGGLLVDPFAGSGTLPVAAVRAGVRFVAGDIHREYCTLMRKRLLAEMGKTVKKGPDDA